MNAHIYLFPVFLRHGLTLTFENQPLLAGSKHVKVRNFLHNYYSKKEKGFFFSGCSNIT